MRTRYREKNSWYVHLSQRHSERQSTGHRAQGTQQQQNISSAWGVRVRVGDEDEEEEDEEQESRDG